MLVTGGAGFIGANFVLDWLAQSAEPVVNLDKLTYAGNLQALATLQGDARHVFVQGDIGDATGVAALLARYLPRAVIHFAAESHVDRSIHGPEDFIQTNVVGTFQLLNAVRAYWSGLPAGDQAAFRLLHVSTDEVYGSLGAGDAPFTESHRYQPNGFYSASKAASDHVVRAAFHTWGLPVLTTHASNNYGPWQFPEKLIPLMVVNALAGKPLPVYGDGRHVRDWIHVRDHCRALRLVLAGGVPGEAYNIGARCERANIDVVQAICSALDTLRPKPDGKPYREQLVFTRDRPGHDRRYAIDPGKVERAFGWTPEAGFEAGLRDTVQWHLDNAAWPGNAPPTAFQQWADAHYRAP
ncbi:MAG: dTDP-glucose 4,6-dehydratase [Haliea sp.]|nr:MAG: dTDP-glucose 4,6-dehydratase [Haliea sp.]